MTARSAACTAGLPWLAPAAATTGAQTARVQAGADPRGLALSGDGQWPLP